jgi:hypothetical protein
MLPFLLLLPVLQLPSEVAHAVLLSPDVAKVFPTDEAVNEALRSLIDLARKSTGFKKRAPRTTKEKTTA